MSRHVDLFLSQIFIFQRLLLFICLFHPLSMQYHNMNQPNRLPTEREKRRGDPGKKSILFFQRECQFCSSVQNLVIKRTEQHVCPSHTDLTKRSGRHWPILDFVLWLAICWKITEHNTPSYRSEDPDFVTWPLLFRALFWCSDPTLSNNKRIRHELLNLG